MGDFKFALAVLILIGCVYGSASPSEIKSWIGKYPTQKNESFFDVPGVKSTLTTILDKSRLKLLTQTYRIETPIEQKGHYLLVKKSLPHCAPCENALLVFNATSGQMAVGFWKSSSKRDESAWYYSKIKSENGGEERLVLPQEILEEFRSMHEPK